MEFPESFAKDIIKLALVVITLSASIYLFRLATSAYETNAISYSAGVLALGSVYFVFGVGFIIFGVLIALSLLGQKLRLS
ncbi:MAG: hypothetical protein M1327_02680 [Candidatus Thermoplasmatota archaeon]|nr:hypothetical protein [Candidatus Thermoplasmatota archaeon]